MKKWVGMAMVMMAGTLLASWTLGLYSLARHVMAAGGGAP